MKNLIDDWIIMGGIIIVAAVGGFEGFLTGEQVTYLMLSGAGFAYGTSAFKNSNGNGKGVPK